MGYPGYLEFGTGQVMANPLSIAGSNLSTPSGPIQLAILGDMSLEFDQQLVELRGQNQWPEDVAIGNRSCKGKGTFAATSLYAFAALGFGDTIQLGLSTATATTYGESGTIPAPSGPYTIQVTNHTTFVTDLGVTYASTGRQFTKVASGPTAGQYSVNTTTGTYTFAAADASTAVFLSYSYTTTANMLTVQQHAMGYGPAFEIFLQHPYQSLPTACLNGIHLFQCKAAKFSAPEKRDGYMMSDFEFQAYANGSGKVFEWTAQYAS